MMTLAQLITWLQAHKGSDHWRAVADAAGVSYDTVARIARGFARRPSVVVVERICHGIAVVEGRGGEGDHSAESRREPAVAQSPKLVQPA